MNFVERQAGENSWPESRITFKDSLSITTNALTIVLNNDREGVLIGSQATQRASKRRYWPTHVTLRQDFISKWVLVSDKDLHPSLGTGLTSQEASIHCASQEQRCSGVDPKGTNRDDWFVDP